MIELVQDNLDAIAQLCVRHRVARLEIFGSAVTGDFEPGRSDLDFLVEFLPGERGGLNDVYFKLRTGLQQLFDRPVDLVERGCVHNAVVAAMIENTKAALYAAA